MQEIEKPVGIVEVSSRNFIVDSESQMGVKYDTWLGIDGKFYCNCQGYQINRTNCKHIEKVKKYLIWKEQNRGK